MMNARMASTMEKYRDSKLVPWDQARLYILTDSRWLSGPRVHLRQLSHGTLFLDATGSIWTYDANVDRMHRATQGDRVHWFDDVAEVVVVEDVYCNG